MPLDEDINADVPQAQTEGIARRLLGDDLVNRYGDVIGARKTTAADVLRDFTIGFQKGQDQVDELHMKVRSTYEDAYAKRQKLAMAQKSADVDTAKTVIDAIKTVQGLPPGQRAAILKETLETAGIPFSKAALKMFTDSDMIAQLPMDDIEAGVADGTIDTATIGGVMGSGLNAAKFMSEATRRRREEQTTGNAILNAEKTRLNKRRDQLKFKLEKAKARLSIKDAQLNVALKEKALAKPGKEGSLFDRLMSEEPETAETPVPPPPSAPAVTAPVVTPGAADVEAAKARLGLK